MKPPIAYRRDIGITARDAEEKMDMWGLVVELLGPVAVGLLLIALGWAALERGSIHRFARRARRIHLAVVAVAGWV